MSKLPLEIWDIILRYVNSLTSRLVCWQWSQLCVPELQMYRDKLIKNRVHHSLSKLQWIHGVFHLSRDEVIDGKNRIFRCAAAGGHLPVLHWLHASFKITRDEAIAMDNQAFRVAARGGHLPVLHWLHSTYMLTYKDATRCKNYAFRHATKWNHFSVANWLQLTYPIPSTLEYIYKWGHPITSILHLQMESMKNRDTAAPNQR